MTKQGMCALELQKKRYTYPFLGREDLDAWLLFPHLLLLLVLWFACTWGAVPLVHWFRIVILLLLFFSRGEDAQQRSNFLLTPVRGYHFKKTSFKLV